ncbi:hypothetical protein GE115_13300 [Agromyces sp. CFH 90414]|uniref:VanZ-like domain-containing protein n=2 Tax=Agromyces agglutinans TaxID=2662258 RepID=A0A6I2FFZ3_9MICO|nr:hypothetical protein [Agromyces agglutinans]
MAALVALFAGYLVLLAWAVLWKLHLPDPGGDLRAVKLVPFVPTADAGASAVREVIANVGLFVPFGLYLGVFAPAWRWWRRAGVFAASSLALEVVQFVFGLGISDVTDVVANTAGGLIGTGLLAVTSRRSRPQAPPRRARCRRDLV